MKKLMMTLAMSAALIVPAMAQPDFPPPKLTLPQTFIQRRLASGVQLGASQRLDRFS
jgi:hypothetical protein